MSYPMWEGVLQFKDSFYRNLINRDVKDLHLKLIDQLNSQKNNWERFVYCNGYFYQGYEKIGISGIKPTQKRMKNYDINEYLNKNMAVLDIGSNNGFLALDISDKVKKVTGIEYNEYLNKIGNETKNYLGIDNVNFITEDFKTYQTEEKYDAILSLSNHSTVDKGLDTSFESFVLKIYNQLNSGGYLFFESHDLIKIDKDMNEKFQTAQKYFDPIKYKMVKKFYPPDVDKLFIVLKKRDDLNENPERIFDINEAKNKYSY